MALTLLREGVFTSLQSLGPKPLQRFGINPRGPMDPFAARTANILVENDEAEPVLEMHFPPPQIEFDAEHTIAISGGEFDASLNEIPLNNWARHDCRAGDILRFNRPVFGSRSYLAVTGGFRTDDAGFTTERLTRNVRIECHRESAGGHRPSFVSKGILPAYSRFPTVRILPGGEFEKLHPSSRDLLCSDPFLLTNDSNRMGFRLKGPKLKLTETTELASAAVSFGTIQLLPDGQLVILMADHQTSGGYPRIANVISADLPLLGQLGPGSKVSFMTTTIDLAEQAADRVASDLRMLRIGVSLRR